MARSIPRRPFAVLRRGLTAAACLTMAALSAGCGSGHKSIYPVRGEVLVEGRPPVHALVTFHPVADDGHEALVPTGSVDDHGRFTLTSYASGDGAPEGEYRVTVAWFLASGRPGDDSPPVNYLPVRYARTDTTPLRAVVRKGGVDLEPFQLQAQVKNATKHGLTPNPNGGSHEDFRRTTRRVHADRAVGGDRDHRHPHRPAAARRPEGARGRRTHQLRQQPQAGRPGPATTTNRPRTPFRPARGLRPARASAGPSACCRTSSKATSRRTTT